MKRVLVSLFIMFIIVIGFSSYSYAGDYVDGFYIEYDNQIYKYKSRIVTIIIDGIEVKQEDMPAIILDDRTLVPVREVFESEAIGASVEWNGEKQEVYIVYKDKFIVLGINNKTAYVNGEPIELDVPAKIIRDVSKQYGKTMIPIRFVSEQMGYEVGWEYTSSKAILSSAEYLGSTNDNEIIDKENNDDKLDYIDSDKAAKELPTALANNPITWTVDAQTISELKAGNVDTQIIKVKNPVTTVSSINYEEGVTNKFVINASSPITYASETIWDGKYIVDIENAIWDLNSTQTFSDNPIVSSIRSSQYSENPMVTRLVFDLKNSGCNLSLSLSQDRKQLIVTATTNSIYSIKLGQNNIGDYISISGVIAPNVEAFRLSNPNRIVFDLPNTESVLSTKSGQAEGQYVTEIRSAQFNDTTTRIVIETNGQADYKITNVDESVTMIQLIEPTYNNIKYENYKNPSIILEEATASFDFNKITYTDNYLEKEYIITLPGDFSSLFGSGELKINDSVIESINIGKDSKGNTRLLIKAKSIYEYRLTQDGENIVLKGYKPRELYSRIIVVDAGHGGKDPGANANGVYEKTLNLNIVKYLKTYLDTNGSIKVYYTRLDDSYPSLGDRSELANDVQADFFLSVHNNAYHSKHNGTETLYFPSRVDNALDSYELAEVFQDKLIKALGLNDRGLKSRDDLYVLKHTLMPAIIVEIGFLTNTEDVAKLKQASFQQKAGKALYDGIVRIFELYPTGR